MFEIEVETRPSLVQAVACVEGYTRDELLGFDVMGVVHTFSRSKDVTFTFTTTKL
jgi:hypothetical protein